MHQLVHPHYFRYVDCVVVFALWDATDVLGVEGPGAALAMDAVVEPFIVRGRGKRSAARGVVSLPTILYYRCVYLVDFSK